MATVASLASSREITKKSNPVRKSRKELGRWGEQLAASHLESLGYQVIERNWRCRRGEIDLVASAGEVLVFVEVKTRRGRDHGMPEEAVTKAKVRRLLELSQRYLLENDLEDVDWRIDLVAVELNHQGELIRCEHVPNAVWAW
jgi:putative endonuclease